MILKYNVLKKVLGFSNACALRASIPGLFWCECLNFSLYLSISLVVWYRSTVCRISLCLLSTCFLSAVCCQFDSLHYIGSLHAACLSSAFCLSAVSLMFVCRFFYVCMLFLLCLSVISFMSVCLFSLLFVCFLFAC